MTWDDHYERFRAALNARPVGDVDRAIREACKHTHVQSSDDIIWLREALADKERKSFVAEVYRYQPVPEALFDEFIRAAIIDVDASNNRRFLAPCIETFGLDRVSEAVQQFERSEIEVERCGTERAKYWLSGRWSKRRST